MITLRRRWRRRRQLSTSAPRVGGCARGWRGVGLALTTVRAACAAQPAHGDHQLAQPHCLGWQRRAALVVARATPATRDKCASKTRNTDGCVGPRLEGAASAVRSQAAHQSATGMIGMPVGVPACESGRTPSAASPVTSAFGPPFQPLPTAGSAIISRARRDAAALCESSGGSQPRSRARHSLRRQAGWPGAMSSSRSTSNSRSATAPHTG